MPILVFVLFAVLFVIVFWILIGYPRWKVWEAHQRGLADLARAKNDQQIQIAQAQSRCDAAELNKKAAIVEAEAVRAQIDTIGTGLQQHDLYLKWQWITMMEKRNAKSDTIYVPTESNIPILEAMRKSM